MACCHRFSRCVITARSVLYTSRRNLSKESICIECETLVYAPLLQVNDWELLFSNAVNGNSLHTMSRLCAGNGATVIAVEDVNGNVFGGS